MDSIIWGVVIGVVVGAVLGHSKKDKKDEPPEDDG